VGNHFLKGNWKGERPGFACERGVGGRKQKVAVKSAGERKREPQPLPGVICVKETHIPLGQEVCVIRPITGKAGDNIVSPEKAHWEKKEKRNIPRKKSRDPTGKKKPGRIE